MKQNEDIEKLKKATLLKLSLRTTGFREVEQVEGIGDIIKENINGLYLINNKEPIKIPNEVVLYDKITTKLVINPDSFYRLKNCEGKYYVFSDFQEEPLFEVGFSKQPKHYKLKTSNGTPMKEIGQVMGNDCLAIAVDKKCANFAKGKPCKYCNINPTNVKSHLPRRNNLKDLAELIQACGDHYRFIDLTGGTFKDRDKECKTYTEMGNVIRDNISRKKFSGPFSLSPPKNLDLLEDLYNTGVDVVSFNMDVWENDAFKKICPGKEEIGKEKYIQTLLRAKEIWGEGNSVMQFLAGPWESNKSLLEGTKHCLDKGILVNLTTYYPSPNSPLKNYRPKTLGELVDLYIDFGEMTRSSGLYPNARKSILTSESGNRSSIANEVVKGYLTKDNFDPEKDLNFAGGYRK